jgi:hypothetical protein
MKHGADQAQPRTVRPEQAATLLVLSPADFSAQKAAAAGVVIAKIVNNALAS